MSEPGGTRNRLRRMPGARLLHHLAVYAVQDFGDGRVRAILFLGLANLLPDLLTCAFLRPYLWRAAGAKLADCASSAIRRGTFVDHPKNLRAGGHFQVNRDSYLDASAPITIGEHVFVSIGCRILTMSHEGAHHEVDRPQPVVIRSHVLIYAGATILPGTVIERYVIVAAGAIVRGATVAGGIYAGVPAVLKGFRKDVDPSLFQADADEGP